MTARKHRLQHLASLALAGALLTVTALGGTPRHAQAGQVLNVGFQTFGDSEFLKNRGTLEKRLAPLGVTVQWTRFPAGPQLLEALRAGSIDVGSTGEAPPIFAQAGGTDLVYAAAAPGNPATEGVLVAKNSSIHSLADLKGKKIAFNVGSNAHYLLIQVLAHAHLSYSDITPVNLAPPDARAAFENGSVDAWVIWDPFLAVEQQRTGARVLVDGKGLDSDIGFYLASRSAVTSKADLLRAFFAELKSTDSWANTHKSDLVATYSKLLGFPVSALSTQLSLTTYHLQPVTSANLASQQRIANAFYTLKLLPKQITINTAAYSGPALVQS